MTSKKERVALLPCPFCGEKADLQTNEWRSGFYVACHTEECCGNVEQTWFTEKAAIAAWNTRAQKQQVEMTEDELVKWFIPLIEEQAAGEWTNELIKKDAIFFARALQSKAHIMKREDV